MSSPVVAFMGQVVTDWEALTPPTRATITYHSLDNKRRLASTAGDRGFAFDLPIRNAVIAEAGAAETQVEWLVNANLRLSQGPFSAYELASAVANESNLLLRAIEIRSSWPAGVLEVITEPTEPERDPDKGDALIKFTFRVLCAETD